MSNVCVCVHIIIIIYLWCGVRGRIDGLCMRTHSQSDPGVQRSSLISEDTNDLVSFWQLVYIQLYYLKGHSQKG